MKYHAKFKMWCKVTILLFFLATFLTPVDAYFRHLCHGQLARGRIDPIISPGKLSMHVHNIQGASGK